MTAKGKVAGNAEMRHERLLGVSRLDGRRRERWAEEEGGERGGKGRGDENIKARGEAAAATAATHGRMKQTGAVEKMKLELTTNGCGLKGRDGPAGRKRVRDGKEEVDTGRWKKEEEEENEGG